MTAPAPHDRCTPRRRSRPAHEAGSVLLPLIAAMLLLLYAGTALTELFGAQRMAAVDRVESAQAHWLAEAGAWHAAQLGTEISTAQALQGGSYTVTVSGDDHTSTATRGSVTREVTLTLTPNIVEEEEEEGPDELIDQANSAASAYPHDDDHFHIDLYSLSASDLEIEEFEMSADVALPNLEEIKLDGKKIVEDADIALPTGVTTVTGGSSSDRTLEALDDSEARIVFRSDIGDEIVSTITLVLYFTDGSSDDVVFTIDWSED